MIHSFLAEIEEGGCGVRMFDLARWGGADEIDEAHGDGWVEVQPNGSLTGEITFHNGDESGFIARR